MTARSYSTDAQSGAVSVSEHVERSPKDDGGESLLDLTLKATSSKRPSSSDDRTPSPLARFLAEDSPIEAILMWLRGAGRPMPKSARQALRQMNRDVAAIDQIMSRQVNAVLHHERFTKLEASWRGLHQLVAPIEEGDGVMVRVLNASWKELTRDLDRAIEFDQSALFRKIYTEEFDMPGGRPYGVLLADYDVHLSPGPEHPFDDLAAVRSMAQVSAAAFAPLVMPAHPSLLGLESFADLDRPHDLSAAQQQTDFVKWRSLRELNEARFIGLTAPRVLMRRPYNDHEGRADRFRFQEQSGEPGRRGHVWGSAVWAFGEVVIRSFCENGWLADIRGARNQSGASIDEPEGGGVVHGGVSAEHATDAPEVAHKGATDAVITEPREQEMADLGFISLCRLKDTDESAFFSIPSIQKPQPFDKAEAAHNAKLSTMLHYMLCVSRFAHYVKVMARDYVGSVLSARDIERRLNDWLIEYCTSDMTASESELALCPLEEGKAQVRERPGKPGCYDCVMHLRPHFQLDRLSTSVKLVTELTPSTSD